MPFLCGKASVSLMNIVGRSGSLSEGGGGKEDGRPSFSDILLTSVITGLRVYAVLTIKSNLSSFGIL